jgi:hypothetical protein
MYKTSNDMKDKIEQICYNLELGCIDWKEASEQLFALYGVGCSSCEDIPKESYYPGMTCEECNQPFRIVKNKQ